MWKEERKLKEKLDMLERWNVERKVKHRKYGDRTCA